MEVITAFKRATQQMGKMTDHLAITDLIPSLGLRVIWVDFEFTIAH